MTNRYPAMALTLVAFALPGCRQGADTTPRAISAVEWPHFGTERDIPTLAGHTNTVPDIVGPVDGSARLTIFTEGNHFPALLPLALDEFPHWSARAGGPKLSADDILIVMLPQGLLVRVLARGGLRLGNAVLPVGPDHPVYPDIVMAGPEALETLGRAGIVTDEIEVFARHKGMGLLLRRSAGLEGLSLAEVAARRPRVVMASSEESGARAQYRETLVALLDSGQANALMTSEVVSFPGRLAIQHRDVPYALLQDLADVGLIFGHLARFYAETYPEELAWTELPGAARLGREIAMAPSLGSLSAETDAFMRFFAEAAPRSYPTKGFAVTP